MADSTPTSKQFLFVNKSKGSAHLSKSVSLENTAIQRHVQTGRKRSRHAKRTDGNLASDLTEKPPEFHSQTLDSVSSSQQAVSTVLRQDGPTEVLQDSHKRISQSTQGCSTSLSSHKLLCKNDPFDATSVPIDNIASGLLHYYIYYYHPSQWPNELALLRHGVYIFQAEVLINLKNAVSDRLAMFCLLAAAASRFQFVDRLPSSLIAGKENYYIHAALQLMSAFISSNDLRDIDSLKHFLRCNSFLNAAEAYRGNLSAAKTHLKAAVKLLEPVGGISKLDNESMRGTLAMADLFLACVNLEPCLLDSSYDPGPASLLDLQPCEVRASWSSSLASSLINRPNTVVSGELEEVVAELVESHEVKSKIWTPSMSATRTLQITHWITIRNMAIRHKLLALKTIDARTDALRIAIIMWTLLAMNVTGRAKTVKIMAARLQSNLAAIPRGRWGDADDTRFWILLVGLYCAKEKSEALAWFTTEVSNVAHCQLQLEPDETCTSELADGLKAFQSRFFFDEEVQLSRTWTIAEKLQLATL